MILRVVEYEIVCKFSNTLICVSSMKDNMCYITHSKLKFSFPFWKIKSKSSRGSPKFKFKD